MKRTLEISREPAHLAVSRGQLLLKRGDDVVGQAPCEDLGFVVVDHPQASYTHAALVALADAGACVVLCGSNHLPAAMVLPLSEHAELVWRQGDQLAAGKPLAKQLWRQLVRAKIRGQARNLAPSSPACRKLLALADEVKSGDPANVEAHAAKLYWQHWLDETVGFRRDAEAGGINAFLNYGYAIVRASIARAIVAAGLLPSLGLHHRRRGNPFCLADDLIEPFRPLVDERVQTMVREGFDASELTQTAKAELLGVLTRPMRLGDQSGPLASMLHRTTASLAACFAGESQRLAIPEPVEVA